MSIGRFFTDRTPSFISQNMRPDTRLTAKLSASACGEDVCSRYIALLRSGMPSWVLYRYRPERPRGGFGGKWWPRSPLRPARPPPARQSHFSCCSTPWHACMLRQSVFWHSEAPHGALKAEKLCTSSIYVAHKHLHRAEHRVKCVILGHRPCK